MGRVIGQASGRSWRRDGIESAVANAKAGKQYTPVWFKVPAATANGRAPVVSHLWFEGEVTL
jgi:hypothetical protein